MSNNSNDENGCLVLIGCIIFPPFIILVLFDMYYKNKELKTNQLTEMKKQTDLLKKQLDPTFKTREEIKIEDQKIRFERELESKRIKDHEEYLRKGRIIKEKEETEYKKYLRQKTIFEEKRINKIKRIKWLKNFKETHANFQNIFLLFSFILMLCTIFYFGFYIQP